MLDKITSIEERYEELSHILENTIDDYQKAAEIAKERSDLEPIVSKSQEYRAAIQKVAEARSLELSDDPDLRELALMDLEEFLPKIDKMEQELKTMLLP
ncbi:MAG: PCRF domain-containing protein, partial [Chloroflexi bacterium]|nr:PCRF domain-containing protein [Chloroflexota bacterium]